MEIKNIGFQHKNLLVYLNNHVKFLEASTDRRLPLKQMYTDYKHFTQGRGQPLLLYRQFRQELQDILKEYPKKNTRILQKNKVWVITNISLTTEAEIMALYNQFYNI